MGKEHNQNKTTGSGGFSMKRRFLLLVLAFVAVFALPACQAASPVTRQISAQGTGKVYLTPDVVYISIGVQNQAEQVSAALKENNSLTEKVSQTLTGMGVDAKDIQTSAFNVTPQQQYGPNGEQTGMIYMVNNTIYVTVRKLDNLGPMLDAVVSAGANNIYGIQFDVQDKEKALADARKMAIDNARTSAAELAGNAGVQLGNLISLNTYSDNSAQPMYEGKGGAMPAAAQVPVSAGQLVLTVTADVVYEIK
jgi:uncharacterized protein YggE